MKTMYCLFGGKAENRCNVATLKEEGKAVILSELSDRKLGINYLVSNTGPHVVSKMLPTACGTVYPSTGSVLPASS